MSLLFFQSRTLRISLENRITKSIRKFTTSDVWKPPSNKNFYPKQIKQPQFASNFTSPKNPCIKLHYRSFSDLARNNANSRNEYDGNAKESQYNGRRLNWTLISVPLVIVGSSLVLYNQEHLRTFLNKLFQRQADDESTDYEDDDEDFTTKQILEQPKQNIDYTKEWWELLLPEFPWFALAIITSFGSSIISLYIPKLMGNMMDIIRAINPSDGSPSPIPGFSFSTPAMICLGIVLGQTALNFIFNYALSIAGDNIASRLREQLFAALLRKDIEYYDKTSTGELISGVSSDVSEVKMAIKHTLSMGMRSITQIAGGFISLFLISKRLTTMMILVMPSLVLVGTIYSRIIQRLSKRVQESLAKTTSVAEESMSNIRTVRSFTSEEKESERYAAVINNYRELSARLGRAVGLFHSFYNICISGGFMLILFMGGQMVVSGQMSSGSLTSYIMYSLNLQSAMVNLSILQGELVKGIGAAARIFDSIHATPRIPIHGGKTLENVKGNIEFKGVSFRYPTRNNVKVLKELNLTLDAGKKYAIVGPSGSGKSTIAWLIERFYEPEKGSILLDQENIRNLDPSWLRKQIALVSQEPVLFATSIFENIRYGNPDATMEDVVRAATMANAQTFINEFPHGYHTVVGERGMQLSGGQKQRIAIARAILKNAKILILDEATSALDAESEYLVQDALQTLMRGKTVIMIAHRLSTVQKADQILVMKNGRIIEIGTHSELMKKKGAYAHLVAKQMS